MIDVWTRIRDRLQGKAPRGAKRSKKWRKVRNEYIKKNPKCALCDGTNKLEVHHIFPFYLYPERELDPTNLITLCESKRGGITCHLAWGHFSNYRRFNPSVLNDCEYWKNKIQASKEFLKLLNAKIK